ncbi:hypothetical protein MUK42_33117 [Musa troglodytarum]|uniref:Uncharacterized protein n=1 Tax=Musa troglodytarum TaxID=320322 RepID=A0A9E7JTM4_9LILI|nr:hypothetical protein MUK42_33117 [Musa troglodytarum]
MLCNKALFPDRVPRTIALTPPIARLLARRNLVEHHMVLASGDVLFAAPNKTADSWTSIGSGPALGSESWRCLLSSCSSSLCLRCQHLRLCSEAVQ